jgi:hypothetical protein
MGIIGRWPNPAAVAESGIGAGLCIMLEVNSVEFGLYEVQGEYSLAASFRTVGNARVYANIPGIFGCEHKAVRRIALLAQIIDEASTNSRPSTHDHKLWAVLAFLPQHYLYDALPLFFVAQVSDVRPLFISFRTSYATRASVCPPETLP